MPCLDLSAIECLLLQLSSDWTSRSSYASFEWLFKILSSRWSHGRELDPVVRREVAVDSVPYLVDLLDRGAQANAERILPLELRWQIQ